MAQRRVEHAERVTCTACLHHAKTEIVQNIDIAAIELARAHENGIGAFRVSTPQTILRSKTKQTGMLNAFAERLFSDRIPTLDVPHLNR